MYQSEELTEPYRYKMAAGIVTNDKQLKQLRKAVLKDQYEAAIAKKSVKQLSPREGSSFNTRSSNRNPEQLNYRQNKKQKQMRHFLADDLKKQIEEKKEKQKAEIDRKLEEEKKENQHLTSIIKDQQQSYRRFREKVRKQLEEDYRQKISYKQKQKEFEEKEKNIFKKKYSQPNIWNERSNTNSPKQNGEYRMKNLAKYEQQMRRDNQLKEERLSQELSNRLEENKQKEKYLHEMNQRENEERRKELRNVLEQQIEDARRRKQEQMEFDKKQFYERKYQNIYNPIYNPVDSIFCKDNKYVMNEMQEKGRKKSSEGEGRVSALARNGSLSLL